MRTMAVFVFLFVLVASGSAVSQDYQEITDKSSDQYFTALIENEVGIASGYSVFNFTNPLNRDIVLNNGKLSAKSVYGKSLNSVSFSYLDSKWESVTTRSWPLICTVSTLDNGTDVESCSTHEEKSTENVLVTSWHPFGSYKVKPGETVLVRMDASFTPEVGPVTIDWVPTIHDNKLEVTHKEWAWWNTSWDSCKNITITEGGFADREWEPVLMNLSPINYSLAEDIRIVNAGCNYDGNEVPRDIVDAGHEYAIVAFLANVTNGSQVNYSVYYDNPSAPTPTYVTGMQNYSQGIATGKFNATMNNDGMWTDFRYDNDSDLDYSEHINFMFSGNADNYGVHVYDGNWQEDNTDTVFTWFDVGTTRSKVQTRWTTGMNCDYAINYTFWNNANFTEVNFKSFNCGAGTYMSQIVLVQPGDTYAYELTTGVTSGAMTDISNIDETKLYWGGFYDGNSGYPNLAHIVTNRTQWHASSQFDIEDNHLGGDRNKPWVFFNSALGSLNLTWYFHFWDGNSWTATQYQWVKLQNPVTTSLGALESGSSYDLEIANPVDGSTYETTSHRLSYTNTTVMDNWTYGVNGGANTTFSFGDIITIDVPGSQASTIELWARDNASNEWDYDSVTINVWLTFNLTFENITNGTVFYGETATLAAETIFNASSVIRNFTVIGATNESVYFYNTNGQTFRFLIQNSSIHEWVGTLDTLNELAQFIVLDQDGPVQNAQVWVYTTRFGRNETNALVGASVSDVNGNTDSVAVTENQWYRIRVTRLGYPDYETTRWVEPDVDTAIPLVLSGYSTLPATGNATSNCGGIHRAATNCHVYYLGPRPVTSLVFNITFNGTTSVLATYGNTTTENFTFNVNNTIRNFTILVLEDGLTVGLVGGAFVVSDDIDFTIEGLNIDGNELLFIFIMLLVAGALGGLANQVQPGMGVYAFAAILMIGSAVVGGWVLVGFIFGMLIIIRIASTYL